MMRSSISACCVAVLLAAAVHPQAKQAPKAALEAQVMAVEKASWEALKKKDYSFLGSTMAEDYFEVDSEGVRNKSQSLQGAKDLAITDYTITDSRFTWLANDVALLSYKATMAGTYKGEAIENKPFYDTVIYKKIGGKWLSVFFQETSPH